ncbi:MAG TPA: hypothetical protein VK978_04060 [Candidatus Saccharimonadales bacterium]|nr:hypothetical protein [Candidatus Saccharimonadales bacterium]
MNIIKILGGVLLFAAGYVTHIILTSDWTLRGKAYIGIIVISMLHLGIVAILVKNGKSFKDSIFDALSWPLNLYP